MRRAISLVVLLLVFSPLTVLSAEGSTFFPDWFEGSLFGSSSEKSEEPSSPRQVADDRDFDVDVADKSVASTTQPEPFIVASHSSHKGATFPLKEFPPLCSEFIDPKDAAKFSHCPGPVQPSNDKWMGYLEFMGKPGTARSLGQTDLFVPVKQDENDMTFFNLRGQMDDTDNSEYNVGFGHRHMFEETSDSPFRGWIIGGYGYFDHRFSETDNKFKQLTFGVEALSEDWDLRANGYIPENKTELITSSSNVTIVRPGDQIRAQISGVFEEKALPGLDLEVGYKLPLSKFLPKTVNDLEWFEDTRLYLSGYHFIGEGNFESITGPRLRLETRVHDIPGLGNGSRLMMGLETQYDDPRGSQTFGLVQLRIPFGGGTNPNRPSLKGLDRRMLQPVIRDVDVVAPQNELPVELTPVYNEEGREYVAAYDVDMDDMGNVTDEEILTTCGTDMDCRMQEMVKARMLTAVGDDEAVLIFVDGAGVGGEVNPMNWADMNIMSGRTVASADRLMDFDFVSDTLGAGSQTFTEEGTAVGTTGGCWTMQPGSQLAGWTVDATGCATGVTVSNEGENHYITNSVAHSASTQNILVSAGNLYVNDLDLYNSTYGVHLTGTAKLRGVAGTDGTLGNFSADDSNTSGAVIYMSGVTQNAEAQVDGVTVDATNVNDGIRVDAASTVNYFINNTTVENAFENGLLAEGDAVLRLTSSKFNNNRERGIWVQGNADVTASFVEASFNGTTIDSAPANADATVGCGLGNDGNTNTDFCRHGIYTMGNSIFTGDNLLATHNGTAGMWTTGNSVVDVSDSVFRDNQTPGPYLDLPHTMEIGTGLFIFGQSIVTVDNVDFVNNEGSGVLINSSGNPTVEISNSLIEGNGWGLDFESPLLPISAAFVSGGKRSVTIDNVTITNNYGIGAAIRSNTVTMTNSRIIGNGGTGLSYDLSGGDFTVSDTVISDNGGDGLLLQGTWEWLDNSQAKDEGTTVTATNLTITNNGGYGVHTVGAEYKKEGERATNYGDGIININNSTVSGNALGSYKEEDETIRTYTPDSDSDPNEWFDDYTDKDPIERNGFFGRIIIDGVNCTEDTAGADCVTYNEQ